MNIVLIGSGNVATHLGQALKKAGNNILQVWSRHKTNASTLAHSLQAEPISQLSSVNPVADIYIIAVKDDVIAEVAAQLPRYNQLLIHTSGSTDLAILKNFSSKIGVLYPLQTFSKAKAVDFKQIPIAIEGNSSEVVSTLYSLSTSLSNKIIKVNSCQRMQLHIAAIFACNFTNHLYNIAAKLLEEQQLDFDLLRPLIIETATKVQVYHPSDVQTGPAIRKDKAILSKHLEILKNNSLVCELYDKLSQSILLADKKDQSLD